MAVQEPHGLRRIKTLPVNSVSRFRPPPRVIIFPPSLFYRKKVLIVRAFARPMGTLSTVSRTGLILSSQFLYIISFPIYSAMMVLFWGRMVARWMAAARAAARAVYIWPRPRYMFSPSAARAQARHRTVGRISSRRRLVFSKEPGMLSRPSRPPARARALMAYRRP